MFHPIRCMLFFITRVLLGQTNLLASQSFESPPDPGWTADVDRVFAAWDKPNSPGCALGVVQHGKLTYQRSYGQANLEHNIPITPSPVFYIASASKQFTAASIALLVKQNKLSLDDDIPKVPARIACV